MDFVKFEQQGAILIQTFSNNSRAALDDWVKRYSAYLEAHDPQRPFYTLIDVSHPHLSFTPYFRQATLNVMQQHQHISGHTVLVFKNWFLARIVEMFFSMQRAKKFETRTFVDRGQALAWLEAKISQEQKQNAPHSF